VRPNVVAQLQQRLLIDVRKILRPGDRVALVDFPNYANVGDSALWLGQKAILRAVGARCVYNIDKDGYHRRTMARVVGDAYIAINGGGNLGDLWPAYQAFREKILRDFPNNRIIQFPQSIHFDEGVNAKRFRSIANSHGAFTLFVRDRRSFAFARDVLNVEAVLTPDSAFGLGRLSRPCAPTSDYMYLRRTDKEAMPVDERYGKASRQEVEGVDWLAASSLEALLHRRFRAMTMLCRFGDSGRRSLSSYMDCLARLRLKRGLALLSSGRTVITDRLHAMILSLLAGIPVIALDNRVGKLSAFIETWLQECDLVQFAEPENLDAFVKRGSTRSFRSRSSVLRNPESIATAATSADARQIAMRLE